MNQRKAGVIRRGNLERPQEAAWDIEDRRSFDHDAIVHHISEKHPLAMLWGHL
jgi:hypothetical protein